jgi:hypothetical protein
MKMKSPMEANDNFYQSYLLRMWKESESGEWRALLLTIPTQERRHFANLQALFDYLDCQAGSSPLGSGLKHRNTILTGEK